MTDIENGFADMAEDLEQLSDKITDKRTEIKALEAGAKPVVEQAKRIAGRFRRAGRLAKSIGAQYSERSNTMRIGIGEPISTTASSTGFYGRFHDRGWQPVNFRRTGRRGHVKRSTRRPTGQFIRNPIFDPAYEAAKERVYRGMIEAYQKEID
jgi:hypothetical protein